MRFCLKCFIGALVDLEGGIYRFPVQRADIRLIFEVQFTWGGSLKGRIDSDPYPTHLIKGTRIRILQYRYVRSLSVLQKIGFGNIDLPVNVTPGYLHILNLESQQLEA
ncbi:hypothetical protein LXL04_013885 [Taraxacum kok-saghyz]